MCDIDSPPELSAHFGESAPEVGAALGLSPGSADRELSFAYELTERLPATRTALEAGQLNLGQAREIATETYFLSPELARAAEVSILNRASGLTRQQLARRLRARALALDPDGAEKRRQDARRGRHVRLDAGIDGTAHLTGCDLPLVEAAAARSFVRGLATKVHADRDTPAAGGGPTPKAATPPPRAHSGTPTGAPPPACYPAQDHPAQDHPAQGHKERQSRKAPVVQCSRRASPS